MTPSTFILAKDVARILGVRTSTLKNWRATGKGPRAYAHFGDTVVAYTRDSVERFIAQLTEEADMSEEFWKEVDRRAVPRMNAAGTLDAER